LLAQDGGASINEVGSPSASLGLDEMADHVVTVVPADDVPTLRVTLRLMGGQSQKARERTRILLIGIPALLALILFAAYYIANPAYSDSASSPSSGASEAPGVMSSRSVEQPSDAPVPTVAAASNDDSFIAAIRGDGITLERNEAILQAHAVCLFVEPPNGGSLFDAGQQVRQMHSSWGIVGATHFLDRSIPSYCPDRAP
jgi:hypothetical protein